MQFFHMSIVLSSIFLLFLCQLGAVADARTCLTSLNLYAETGGKKHAWTSGGIELEVFCTRVYSYAQPRYEKPLLKDAGSDTFMRNKGHVWEYGLGTETCCASIDDVYEESRLYQGHEYVSNAWYVTHAILYAQISDGGLAIIGMKYKANTWVSQDDYLILSKDDIEQDNCNAKDQCIKNLYVMADTADHTAYAASRTGHSFKVNDEVYELYNLKGNDMKKKKADLWKFPNPRYSKEFSKCIKFGDVAYTGFKARGTDAWLIETAIVAVKLESGKYALLAGDVNMKEAWVEKEKKRPERSDVPLTLRNSCNPDSAARLQSYDPDSTDSNDDHDNTGD